MSKKYYIWVLGCQMNKSDSERADSVFKSIGFKKTIKLEEADIIMVMACSVRQSAIDRIFGKLKNWHGKQKLILTGCVLPQDKSKMKKIFDLIIDNKDIPKIPKMLGLNKVLNNGKLNFFSIKPDYGNKFSAFVPIMIGCDNFCTYCAVPYTKGREKSRSFRSILREVNYLVSSGYKEIVLLGQNVNSYGKNLKDKKHNFSNLLKSVNNIKGDFWIRFITSNPHDMSDDIIEAISSSEKVTEYIHLPIQAGNNEILKKMNRKYTQKKYFILLDKLRKKIPNMSLSTDIIVGFPGETLKQFQDSKAVFRKAKYDMAYIAQYSKRAGTQAARMNDNVSKKEKLRREKTLTKILEKTAKQNNRKYLNKEEIVLVDKSAKNYLYSRTRTFKSVRFRGDKSLVGCFVKIKITNYTSWSLSGEIKK